MKEIKIEDVRAGDVARSNGREFRVAQKTLNGGDIRLTAEAGLGHWVNAHYLDLLGVTFHRPARELPTYPGARIGAAGKTALRSAGPAPLFRWLASDAAGFAWKSDREVLDWIGHDWQERTEPPARWVEVDPEGIETGDFIRFELLGGVAVEGRVDSTPAVGITFLSQDWTFDVGEPGKWFKRTGGESDA